MPEDTERIVLEILAHRKTFDPAAVNPEATLASLGIDSLEGLEVIFKLEDRFDISISDEAARQMKTVGQVVAGVRHLVGEPRSTTS